MSNSEFSPTFLMTYMSCWMLACVVALVIFLKDRKPILSEISDYPSFLCIPWKLIIFVPAFLFITFAGRFTNDETWDIVTGGGMSVLTFLSAPLSVGLFYQVVTGKKSLKYLLLAVVLCLFSSSWFYDGYLILRDGHYTSRWFGNLLLSPIIYIAAGLLWNLEAKGAWPTFSFLRSDWPAPPIDQRFGPLVVVSLPLITIGAVVLISFVRWHF